MLNITICVSGGGTNLQAILDAVRDGVITNTKPVLVIASNSKAYALERAKQAGLETAVISKSACSSEEELESVFLDKLKEAHTDLIVLAGFLMKIPAAVIRAYEGRIINIHPSLIPSFCGQGYYGLKVHEAALERGVKITGATVHFVDEGMDSGPIIMQKPVAVRETDTAEILQKRVMEEAEWQILPQVINLIAHDQVSLKNGFVSIKEKT